MPQPNQPIKSQYRARFAPLPTAFASAKRSHSRADGFACRAHTNVKCLCSHQVVVIAIKSDGIRPQTGDTPSPCVSSNKAVASTTKPTAPTRRNRVICRAWRPESRSAIILPRINTRFPSNIEPHVAPLHFRSLVLAKRVAYAVMSRHDATQRQRAPEDNPIAVVERSEQPLRLQRQAV